MVFRRRDRRSIARIILELLWPRGGWSRAFQYVKHRLHRLPGTPETIARGIMAGVFTSFTPFYGLHFLTAFIVARVVQGNALAAILATFFGNPITYVPISVMTLRMGYWLLGREWHPGLSSELFTAFGRSWQDLWNNFIAIFTDDTAQWGHLAEFYDGVFLPWMVGCILPGIVAGIISYYLTVPVIRAYQKRRSGKIRAKIEALKKKAAAQAEVMHKHD